MANITLNIKKKDSGYYSVNTFNGLNKVSVLSESNIDASSVYYCIIPNSGSIDFIDKNDGFKNLIDAGLIDNSDIECDVIVNGNKIQNSLTTDTNYLSTDNKINLSLSDKLSSFYNVKSFVEYDYIKATRTDAEFSLIDVLFGIFNICGYTNDNGEIDDIINNLCSGIYDYTGITIRDYIDSIKLKYALVRQGIALDELLEDFCQLIQCSLICDNDGVMRFISSKQLVINDENAILIPKNIISKELEYSIVNKNKIKGLSVTGNYIDFNIRKLTKIKNMAYATFDDLYSAIKLSEVCETSRYNTLSDFNSDDSIIKETYLGWNIYHKKIDVDGFIKISGSRAIYGMYQLTNTGFMIDSDTARCYSSIDEFKQFLDNLPSEYVLGFGFLSQKDIYEYYVSSYEIIFAFKQNYTLYEPIQIFYITGPEDERYPNPPAEINTIKIDTYTKQYGDVSDSSKTLSISSNNFLTNEINRYGLRLDDLIAYNIQREFDSGLKSASIEIMCSNLYNLNGNIVKNFSNGDLINVNDIIHIENDFNSDMSNRYWKVISREFNYDGEPLVSLKLQECKKIVYEYGLFDKNDILIYDWDFLIDSGYITTSNNIITGSIQDLSGVLKIPDTIVGIGDSAFSGCNLIGVIMPDSIISIGNNSFYSCFDMETLILNNGLLTIGNNAFKNNLKLRNIIIPNTTTSIGESAFQGCSRATSLSIGTGVTSIGRNAFASLQEIENLYYNIPNLASTYAYLSIFNSLGYLSYQNVGCKLIIGNSVNNIPDGLLNGITQITPENIKLTSISFENNSICETVGRAFNFNTELKNISFPSSLKLIKSDAFYADNALLTVSFEDVSGWKYNGQVIDLSNPETNAELFKNGLLYDLVKD